MWAQSANTIRWFTDGERRYGKALWPLASEWVSHQGLAATYPFRNVWREGLDVAIKIMIAGLFAVDCKPSPT